MGKLSGIRVLDLSQFLPGPMMTMMMADQGAEVLKIEPPAGDPARTQAPFEAGQSVWFRSLNRRKQSLVLDLKSPDGKEIIYELARQVDVIWNNFSPGTSCHSLVQAISFLLFGVVASLDWPAFKE